MFSEQLSIGTAIESVKANHEYKYYKVMNYNIPAFSGLQFGIMTYTPDLQPPALLCSIVEGQVSCIYGILDGVPPNSYLLIDTNGDGVLDYQAENNYIPNWVLFKYSIKRSNPNEFLSLCNDLYYQYNSTEGPSKQFFEAKLQKISDIVLDKTATNRDLYYSLLSYAYSTKQPIIALGIITSLSKYIAENYNSNTSPLLLLYAGESLINVGNTEAALSMFTMLKSVDRKSIIADYYISYLNDKKSMNTTSMSNFQKKNPNFWINK
jgi:hypothetical protein